MFDNQPTRAYVFNIHVLFLIDGPQCCNGHYQRIRSAVSASVEWSPRLHRGTAQHVIYIKICAIIQRKKKNAFVVGVVENDSYTATLFCTKPTSIIVILCTFTRCIIRFMTSDVLKLFHPPDFYCDFHAIFSRLPNHQWRYGTRRLCIAYADLFAYYVRTNARVKNVE